VNPAIEDGDVPAVSRPRSCSLSRPPCGRLVPGNRTRLSELTATVGSEPCAASRRMGSSAIHVMRRRRRVGPCSSAWAPG
jgi:hypothetical protein